MRDPDRLVAAAATGRDAEVSSRREAGPSGRATPVRSPASKPVIMSFTMASLLVHSDDVPTAARDALRAARDGAPEYRLERLESAARILHREMGVGCLDARELVDLQPGDCAGG